MIKLIQYGRKTTSHKKLLYYLILVLIGECLCDIAWILHITKYYYVPLIPFELDICIIRISWAFCIIEYFALSLFIKTITKCERQLNFIDRILLIINIIGAGYYLYLALFNYNITSHHERPLLEMLGMKFITLYMFIVIIPTIYFTLKTIKKNNLPKILQDQLKIFLYYIVIPKLILEFFNQNPSIFLWPFFNPIVTPGNYTSLSISTILMAYAIYFSAKRMMGLRFLNFAPHVETSQQPFNFINDFKLILEQLGLVIDLSELKHITRQFFANDFNVSANKVNLYIRSSNKDEINEEEQYIVQKTEKFITSHIKETTSVGILLRHSKILIKDELEFTYFYENKPDYKIAIDFLKEINADIFIPIFEKQTVTGYIIIDKEARKQLYTAIERDEMLVFVSYLGNIINLLRQRNLDTLLIQEKELKEELYIKHQEINQYKESIRSFLRTSQERKIGIIFYKNKRFVFGNQAARELIPFNINHDEGHPLSKYFRDVVHHVQQYKSAQSIITRNVEGKKLVIAGIPSLEDNYTLITVYYPEITDIIKQQIDLLKNPSEWDYLLYLETTPSGQLINQLIPGSGEHLLNFKIDLLKTALHKKTPLLMMPQKDLLPTVEIIHKIGLKQTLHIIKLITPEKNNDIAIKLFGFDDPLKISRHESLLEKYTTSATIYIENIEFLNLETQLYLAEFLRYGFFHVYKGDRKITSSARIVCSTQKNIEYLIAQGQLLPVLCNELNKMTLTFPSLHQLPTQELHDLADKYAEQTIPEKTLSPLLQLNAKEKDIIISQNPTSLYEFKERINTVLAAKNHDKKGNQAILHNHIMTHNDPQLLEATRRGKYALKDPHIMSYLWNTFKNQTKIAMLLGVNRSSVNRRCKEYNLTEEE
ncbi:MAG: sigma 54-interacting transcriptional regulator [Candidatus Babeliaceae bacterium]|jgi:transcriptional regulator with GAF, ATPase, and Fis domain